jgi:hypothetical protein
MLLLKGNCSSGNCLNRVDLDCRRSVEGVTTCGCLNHGQQDHLLVGAKVDQEQVRMGRILGAVTTMLLEIDERRCENF